MTVEYSRGERIADACVHVVGGAASVAAFGILLIIAIPELSLLPIVSLAIYGIGLVTMFILSAGYNIVTRPSWKSIMRRLDHAAIFVMIAGTYTPIMLVAVQSSWGYLLLALVWMVAVAGVLLKLLVPRRFERASILLYLVQGWAVLATLDIMVSALSVAVLVLLGLGGGLYTIGLMFHLMKRMPYHNVIWHVFVLVAAGCHYAAILDGVALS